MDPADRRVGQVLRDKWQLDALLGVGGMATVYSATHRNGKRAAIKILHPSFSAQPDLVTRFLREGYVANKIEHPASVAVLDDDQDADGTVFLVMDLLTGQSLERFTRQGSPRLPLGRVLGIVHEVLDLLIVSHRHGIVHRDLKPANVFLTSDSRVKVLDFGIARLAERAEDASAAQTGSVLGTPSYMPPEQARGRWGVVDIRTDLWAVGATTYALITGDRPRCAETDQEELLLAMTKPLPSLAVAAPSTPPAVVAWLERALAFEIKDRWPDPTAMQVALREVMRASGVPNLPQPRFEGGVAAPSTGKRVEAPSSPSALPAARGPVTNLAAARSVAPPAKSPGSWVTLFLLSAALGALGFGVFSRNRHRLEDARAAAAAEESLLGPASVTPSSAPPPEASPPASAVVEVPTGGPVVEPVPPAMASSSCAAPSRRPSPTSARTKASTTSESVRASPSPKSSPATPAPAASVNALDERF